MTLKEYDVEKKWIKFQSKYMINLSWDYAEKLNKNEISKDQMKSYLLVFYNEYLKSIEFAKKHKSNSLEKMLNSDFDEFKKNFCCLL